MMGCYVGGKGGKPLIRCRLSRGCEIKAYILRSLQAVPHLLRMAGVANADALHGLPDEWQVRAGIPKVISPVAPNRTFVRRAASVTWGSKQTFAYEEGATPQTEERRLYHPAAAPFIDIVSFGADFSRRTNSLLIAITYARTDDKTVSVSAA
jgi:hypothetical protein